MADKKSNIRSFRYSDQVAEILDSMEGANLNAKFENLVLECYVRLPEVRRQLEVYQNLIREERAKYAELYRHRDDVRECLELIQELHSSLTDVTQLVERCKPIGDAAD